MVTPPETAPQPAIHEAALPVQTAQTPNNGGTPLQEAVPSAAPPPEAPPKPTAEAVPSATTGQPAISAATPTLQGAPLARAQGNPAKIVRKQVRKAKREFVKKLVALMETESRGFYLRLCITLSYIWLKIGEKDAYVDEVLAKLHEQYKDAWVRSKTTLQHYEGPMLRWLKEVARGKNPEDPNLQKKFTIVFLRQYPQYIVDAPVEELSRECRTLIGLDKQYGNGCVKPDEQNAELCAEGIAPVVNTDSVDATTEAPQDSKSAVAEKRRAERSTSRSQKRRPIPTEDTKPPAKAETMAKTAGADQKSSQGCKLRSQPRQPASVEEDEEAALPSNDELLVKILAVEQTMLAMKQEGIPIDGDSINEIAKCLLLAKQINKYFGITGPSRAGAASLRVIVTPAQSPTLPVSTDRNGSTAPVGPGSSVLASEPIPKPTRERRRAAKRRVEMPAEPTAPLPGPEDDQPPLFTQP